jgi:hypothetical protein
MERPNGCAEDDDHELWKVHCCSSGPAMLIGYESLTGVPQFVWHHGGREPILPNRTRTTELATANG